jgi:hypothetical protein
LSFTKARSSAAPNARCACTGGSTAQEPGYNPACRPGDRGGFAAVEESPDTTGQDAPDREAAKADGKWHRKQTAGDVISGDVSGKGETVG